MNLEFTRAPHRGRNDAPVQHNAALLIDFDNVTMGIRSNLGQELRNLLDSDVIRGKVAVQRAYADWRRYPQYIVPLSESSIDLIFAPAYGSSKKNATDIRLAIDALELVFTRPEIGTFILLSGDSDFSSLVLKLKEYGKYVIGVGLQESTSDILVQNCDEYYSYNRLSGLMSADEVGAEKHDPWTLVGRAVTRMAKRDDVMRSDRLKQVMLEIDPSFDEKTAGFNKFNRFLAEAAHKELVRLRKGENGQYEVAPGQAAAELESTGGPVASASPRGGSAPPREETSRSRGRRRRGGSRSGSGRGGESRSPSGGRAAALAVSEERSEPEPAPAPATEAPFEAEKPAVALGNAYEALATVVELLYDGEPIRDSMAKRKLLERDETFDEASLGFRKFSSFLRQANDEGIVDLSQGEDGNYYLCPVAGADAHPSRTRGRGGDRDREARREQRERGARRPDRDERPAAVEEERAETPPAEAPDGREARAEEGGGPAESALSAAKAAAKRTLGRFRRGSGAGAPGSESSAPRIGPVVTSSDAEPEEAAPAVGEGESASETRRDTAPAAGAAGGAPAPRGEPAPERTDSAPRGLGRYRSGSRGRASASRSSGSSAIGRIGPVTPSRRDGGEPTPSEDGDTLARYETPPARPEPAAGEAPAPGSETGREAVDHMIRNYPGVGKRTAEALVDRFGSEVFEVIDREPDRLNEVISEGRARAVIEARKGEREA